ncbi:hypothetical protein FOCC_FOCC004033 [Frankliniella occidentalis]|uniref:Uncharacterized protein LOC113212231 n=1 Tax=Frankliniella occidentalis TaxID=133901 RepID=A0A9C6WMG0_FRAOC|nr:uncharacterized protein LOC113212231 [Frankliniella occidentalis]KAE8749125.1 hypothetical protein FOCC_FOCC004033 [Frankliniella occidentalis]
MSKRRLFSCAQCPDLGKRFKLENDKSAESLNEHYRNQHWGISSFVCSVCNLLFDHKTSLIRHMVSSHQDEPEVMDASFCAGPSASSVCDDDEIGNDNEEMGNASASDTTRSMDTDACNKPPSKGLTEVAGEIVMELRSTARLTNAAIQRFQKGYDKLVTAHNQILFEKMSAALKAKGMLEDDINEVWTKINVPEDPFKELKTVENQLKFYEKKYGLVIPKEYFLDTRVDNRLNPKINEFVPTQVTESFQYVHIIETMKLILSNKSKRNAIFKDLLSNDGVLRSYVDGSDCKDHPFLQRHRNVLHIILFYDDLEIAAPLGSKTVIHKLGVFFFQILNGSAHAKSRLSSIHLLALAYSQDLKKKGAFKKVLFHFVEEMKKLGSEEGVEITLDGAPFTLRAILVAVCADTLAAHELLGFLSSSALHFCRICMINRGDFRENGNEEAPLRTKHEHDNQVREVKEDYSLSTQYGVKDECCLNDCPFFHCVNGSVFDAFHDLLEGVVPAILKYVLRNFVKIRKLFNLRTFNSDIAGFSYGIPDSKNKPKDNFVMKMITTGKPLRQSGTNLWCLMRVFPFLVGPYVPEGDEHMELIFITQDIMKIVFSFEISEADLVELDSLIFKLLDNFKRLFVRDPNEANTAPTQNRGDEDEEEDVFLDDSEENEENENEDLGVNEPEPAEQEKPLNIHLFNKLHHLKHYVYLMKRFGPIVRFWCAKFEGSLKIFRQYAAICCNFKNPPKTMAQMFQLSHLWSIISTAEDDDDTMMEFGSTTEMSLENVEHRNLLEEAGITQFSVTNMAMINGEEYRPGLFLAFKEPQARVPEFAIITDIYVVDKRTAYFALKPWKSTLSGKYNAYKISADETSAPFLRNVLSLENFRPIASWNLKSGDMYLAPRTQIL